MISIQHAHPVDAHHRLSISGAMSSAYVETKTMLRKWILMNVSLMYGPAVNLLRNSMCDAKPICLKK